MSADNFIGVYEFNGKFGVMPNGCMSMLEEDCQYTHDFAVSISAKNLFDTRAAALVTAHDICKDEYIVEYGVIELGKVDDAKPCGRCFVCVHNRHIIANDIDRCDGCNEPLINERTGLSTGWYCRSCAREIRAG